MDKKGHQQPKSVDEDPRSVLARPWTVSPGNEKGDENYFSSDTSPGSFTMVSTPTHEQYEIDSSDEAFVMDETSFADLEDSNDDLPIVNEVLGTPLEIPTSIQTYLSVDQIAAQIFNSVRGELKRFGETKAIEIAFEKFEIEGINSTELIQSFAKIVADANFKILIDGNGKLFVCRRKHAQDLAKKYKFTVLDPPGKQTTTVTGELSSHESTSEEDISLTTAQRLAEEVKSEREPRVSRFRSIAGRLPKTIVNNIPLFGALHKKAEMMERYGEYEKRTGTAGKVGDFFNLYSSNQFQWNGEVNLNFEGEGEIRSVKNLEFSSLESEEERNEIFNRHGLKFSLDSAFHYSNLIDTLGGGVELALTVGAMLGGLTQVATNLGKASAAIEYLNEGLKTVRTLNWVRYPIARIAQSISDRILGERNSKEVLTSLALSIPAVIFTMIPGRFLSEGTGILSGELLQKLGLPLMPANMTGRSAAIATRWYLTQVFYAIERKFILPHLASSNLYSSEEISNINKAFTKDASSIRSLLFSIAYELGPNEGLLGKLTPGAVRGRVGKLFTKLSDEAGLGLFNEGENSLRNQLATDIDEKTSRGQTNVIGGEHHPHFDKRGGFSRLKTDIEDFLQGDGGNGVGVGNFVEVQNFDIDPGEATKSIFLHEGTNDVYVMEATDQGTPTYTLYGKLYQQEGFRAIRVKDWDDSSPDKVMDATGKEFGEVKEWQGVGEVITSSNNENLGYEIIDGDQVVPIMKYGDGYISFNWMIAPDDKVQAFNIDNKSYVRVNDELYEVTGDSPVSSESIVKGVEFFDADSDLGKKSGNKDAAYLTSDNRIIDTEGQEINSIELTYIAEDGALFIIDGNNVVYDGDGNRINDILFLSSPRDGQFIVKYGGNSFYHVDPSSDNKVDVLTPENLEAYGVNYDVDTKQLSVIEDTETEEPETPVTATATITPTLESETPILPTAEPLDSGDITGSGIATEEPSESVIPENAVNLDNKNGPDYLNIRRADGSTEKIYVQQGEKDLVPYAMINGERVSIYDFSANDEKSGFPMPLHEDDQVLGITYSNEVDKIYVNGNFKGYQIVDADGTYFIYKEGDEIHGVGTSVVQYESDDFTNLSMARVEGDSKTYFMIGSKYYYIDENNNLQIVGTLPSVPNGENIITPEPTEEPSEPNTPETEIPANSIDLNKDGAPDTLRIINETGGTDSILIHQNSEGNLFVSLNGEVVPVINYTNDVGTIPHLFTVSQDTQVLLLFRDDNVREIYVEGSLKGYQVLQGDKVYYVLEVNEGKYEGVLSTNGAYSLVEAGLTADKTHLVVDGKQFNFDPQTKKLQLIPESAIDQTPPAGDVPPPPKTDEPENLEEYFAKLDEAKVLTDEEEVSFGLDLNKNYVALPEEEFSEDYILELDKNRKIAVIIDLDGTRIARDTPEFNKIVGDIRIEAGKEVVVESDGDAIVMADFHPILNETVPPDYLKKDVIVQEAKPAVTTPDWQDAAKLWTREGGRNERNAALGVAQEVYEEMVGLSPSEVDDFKIKYALPADYELPTGEREQVAASLYIASKVIQGEHYPLIQKGIQTDPDEIIKEWQGYHRNIGWANPPNSELPYSGAVDDIVEGIKNSPTTPGTQEILTNRLPEIARDFGLDNPGSIVDIGKLEDAFKANGRYQNMTPEDFEAMMKHYFGTDPHEIKTEWDVDDVEALAGELRVRENAEKIMNIIKANPLWAALCCIGGLGLIGLSGLGYVVVRSRRGYIPPYVHPATVTPAPTRAATPATPAATTATPAATTPAAGTMPGTTPVATTMAATPALDMNQLFQQLNANQAQMYRRMTAYQLQLVQQITNAQPNLTNFTNAIVAPLVTLVTNALNANQAQTAANQAQITALLQAMQQQPQAQTAQPVQQNDPVIIDIVQKLIEGLPEQNLAMVQLIDDLPTKFVTAMQPILDAGNTSSQDQMQALKETLNEAMERERVLYQRHVEFLEERDRKRQEQIQEQNAQILALRTEVAGMQATIDNNIRAVQESKEQNAVYNTDEEMYDGVELVLAVQALDRDRGTHVDMISKRTAPQSELINDDTDAHTYYRIFDKKSGSTEQKKEDTLNDMSHWDTNKRREEKVKSAKIILDYVKKNPR